MTITEDQEMAADFFMGDFGEMYDLEEITKVVPEEFLLDPSPKMSNFDEPDDAWFGEICELGSPKWNSYMDGFGSMTDQIGFTALNTGLMNNNFSTGLMNNNLSTGLMNNNLSRGLKSNDNYDTEISNMLLVSTQTLQPVHHAYLPGYGTVELIKDPTLAPPLPSQYDLLTHNNKINGTVGSEQKMFEPENWMLNSNNTNSALSKKLSYLDIDHCYSAPPIPYEDDTFNSSPCSPASSTCSGNYVSTSNKSRPKNCNGRKRKSCVVNKQKSECETVSEVQVKKEVDIETIPSKGLQTVPKIVIRNPVRVSSTYYEDDDEDDDDDDDEIYKPPQKRGRKPSKSKQGKKSTAGKQKTSKNPQIHLNPKTLQAAIKKQSYITKSGRVSKINNSVETTPSSSSPSSLQSSRCNSDTEEAADKRASHNMAERNRRQELCNLFQRLREHVPILVNNPKASKVLILNSARNYVEDLKAQDIDLTQARLQAKAKLESTLARLKSVVAGHS